MKYVRAKIEDWIYEKLKNGVLKYSTWNDVINEALAMFLEKHEKEPRERAKALIVETYYRAKRLKRIIAMLHSLEIDTIRLLSRTDFEADPYVFELVSELSTIVKEMKEKLRQIEKEELEEMKRKGIEEVEKNEEEENN